MAARTGSLSKRRPHMPATSADLYSALCRASKVIWLRLMTTAASRRTRARLGMLGVPLAITASLITGLWWTVVPLALCAWWWAPRYTGWEWVGAVGRGLVGAAWALLGSGAFVSFPNNALAVGAFWLLGAGLLVGPYALRHWVFQTGKRQSAGVHMRLNRVPSVRRRYAMHLTIQRNARDSKAP